MSGAEHLEAGLRPVAERLARARAARRARLGRGAVAASEPAGARLTITPASAAASGAAAAAAAALFYAAASWLGGGGDVVGIETASIGQAAAPVLFGAGGDVAAPPPVAFGAPIAREDALSGLVSDRAFAEAARRPRVALRAPTVRPAPPTEPAALKLASIELDDPAPPTLVWFDRQLAAALGAGFTAHENRLAAPDAAAERACLAEAIYFEARGETIEGQAAVAEVILTRAESKFWPDTVCGVVRQGAERGSGCQFSYQCDGRADRPTDADAYARAEKIADFMLSGAPRRLTDGATHYHTVDVAPTWARELDQTRRIGVHVFYRRVLSSRPAARR